MKQIDVPLFLQDHGSIDCGPTCVQMVLKYYGIEKTQAELKARLTYDQEVGTSIYDNGVILLEEGFKTTVVTANPLLFSPDIIATLHNEEDILQLVQKHISDEHKQAYILKTFENYLQKKGKVTLEIPAFDHIKKAIDEEKPVIVLMYAQSLGSNEGTYHFVIVTGYRDNEVFINNPWPKSQKQGWFPVEQLLYGTYASSCVAIDNGSFLIASK